jgi:error-prone DNA polymerase
LGFAAYGFPKGHAASFAVLAYQSAWLKHYYPAEFLCALLNNQPMGFYPVHVLSNEARRRGVRVLSPDINRSGTRCTVEDRGTVRLGFGHVRGLGETAAAALVTERAEHGPYRSLSEMVRRVPLSREAIEALAVVGAFDQFGLGRREAIWQAGLFIPARRFGNKRREGDYGHQVPLALPVSQDQVALPPMSAWERMDAEYHHLGLSPHWHPLRLLRPRLSPSWLTATDLDRAPHGMTVTLAGLVVCRQRPGTAKGITFLLLEDETGLVNVIVSRQLYETQRRLVRGVPFLVVKGRLEKQHGTINVVAAQLRELEAVPAALRQPPADPTDATEPAGELVGIDAHLRVPASHDYR